MQLKAIMDSQAPTSRKGVQQQTGQLAALRQFISYFTDRLITLKGAIRAGWNKGCDQAFMSIKQYLAEPPILASLGARNSIST